MFRPYRAGKISPDRSPGPSGRAITSRAFSPLRRHAGAVDDLRAVLDFDSFLPQGGEGARIEQLLAAFLPVGGQILFGVGEDFDDGLLRWSGNSRVGLAGVLAAEDVP